MPDLRVVKYLIQVHNDPARNAAAIQVFNPVFSGLGSNLFLNQAIGSFTIGHSTLVGTEIDILVQMNQPQRFDELLVDLFATWGDGDISVFGSKNPIRGDDGMVITRAPGQLSCSEVKA